MYSGEEMNCKTMNCKTECRIDEVRQTDEGMDQDTKDTHGTLDDVVSCRHLDEEIN